MKLIDAIFDEVQISQGLDFQSCSGDDASHGPGLVYTNSGVSKQLRMTCGKHRSQHFSLWGVERHPSKLQVRSNPHTIPMCFVMEASGVVRA